MSFWNLLFSWLDNNGSTEPDDDDFTSQHNNAVCFNPSTGIPMANGTCSGIDVAGNPYGVDLSSHHCSSLTDITDSDSGIDWPDMSGSSDQFSPWGD